MKSKHLNGSTLPLLLLSLLACTVPSHDGIDPDSSQKGTVSGRATDAAGKPLPNANIVINNTQFYNHNILGQTDGNGQYKLALTPGSWYVRGTVPILFDNKKYVLDLHPDSDAAFAGTEGAIRNLSLKIAGERTGQFGNDGYYGGQVEVFTWGLPGEQITLTLQPVGTLLDGTTGKTIAGKLSQGYLEDVPLGKYTVSAKLGGQPLQVRVRNSGQEYRSSVTASFDPAYPGAEGRYKLNIEVSE
ncbi:carboxypeptidase-like regulatory domain-containing protein [Salmonirosea aquatica]|uniref:Carboxypeptidase regulatory-like domain-containing protein n=1 Tax=Salmonirosea aquatica TaxID=2654236 RepID=A0A7C9BIJ1_9BACT|nr:hypothetical protein [Cytophagaceae bacterium SJW1-29]